MRKSSPYDGDRAIVKLAVSALNNLVAVLTGAMPGEAYLCLLNDDPKGLAKLFRDYIEKERTAKSE